MDIRWLWTILIVLLGGGQISAQTNWQFRWKKGDTLTYRVKHVTDVAEVVDGKPAESNSKLDLVKRWVVNDVDAQGTGTLELSLTAMRNEQKRTSGETLLFDSQNLDKSTPELREQMVKYINTPVAILRIDRHGRVLEAKLGSMERYDAEPVFVVVFPDAKPAAGQSWRRPYEIVLAPPHGTGEKHAAEQLYQCKKIEAGKATLAIATNFKVLPDNLTERWPLMQKDMQGEVVFDIDAGRLVATRMTIDKTIENHLGKGSKCRFQSQYVETLVE